MSDRYLVLKKGLFIGYILYIYICAGTSPAPNYNTCIMPNYLTKEAELSIYVDQIKGRSQSDANFLKSTLMCENLEAQRKHLEEISHYQARTLDLLDKAQKLADELKAKAK